MAEVGAKRGFMDRMLDGIEKVGNKVPHPAVIFLVMIGVVIVASVILSALGSSVTLETTDADGNLTSRVVAVQSLLSTEGLRFMLTSWVDNFMGFTATGMILVAMIGVGVSEQTGLVAALIRKIVKVTPARFITFVIVLLGGLSSIAADAGYVVLIPLGAMAFMSLGRHPLAGIAAAFAGVSAIFGVNILITPLDGALTEITNDAIALVQPGLTLDLTATMWFSIVSLVAMAALCAWITEKYVEPHLGKYDPAEAGPVAAEGTSAADAKDAGPGEEAEARGLRYAGWTLLAILAAIVALSWGEGAVFRNPETGSLISNSPLMHGLIVLVAILFLGVGVAYGIGAKTLNSASQAIGMIDQTFRNMGPLVFLFLVIAQFLAFFGFTNIATVLAVNMADMLVAANLGSVTLIIGFVIAILLLDVIMPGAIPKWAIFAPIFIPLFIQLGSDPATVLAAYRVADSPMNVVTPLMGYFPLVVIYCQQYVKDAGVGTVIAIMLPYTMWLVPIWTAILVGWYLLGIPWGF
ncbi:AbgT family transporter [Sandaracinobacteroides hominis]|uniref:AbgT family transporter n=1 Tax=Sandaracinobacteroides hominis TaxID=2780086 RepID=UPI0018F4EB5D|nr:AbgT family transporter [Sandaracinobacteroides hominis]